MMNLTFITSPQEGGWLLPWLCQEQARDSPTRAPPGDLQRPPRGFSFRSRMGLPKVKHLTLAEPGRNLGLRLPT